MTPERIRAELERGSEVEDWEARDADLASRFVGVDEQSLFDGLFSLAVMSQTDAPACDAARMLYRLKPRCSLSCREAIEAMLPRWDVSLEEVVFYLVEQFGAEHIRAAIGGLEKGWADEQQLKYLNTVRYWTECFEQMLAERRRSGEQP